jgi:UDP-glucose 4-epimerase
MNCHVLAIDTFARGKAEYLPKHERLTIAEVDIRADELHEVLAKFAPDTIYHLAANHFIPDCIKDPVGTVGINVLGTQNLLTAVEALPPSTFVFASTGDVYVAATEKHTVESPLGSTNIYGVSKVCGESLVHLAKIKRPQSTFRIARLFNVYGPEETNTHVLPDIMLGLKSGGALPLGNLEPLRDYVYVADVVDAFIRLGQYRGENVTFNIATGKPASVREILATIERILGRSLQVIRDPAKNRSTDRPSLSGDPSLALQELHWEPQYSLERGLKQLLAAEGIR